MQLPQDSNDIIFICAFDKIYFFSTRKLVFNHETNNIFFNQITSLHILFTSKDICFILYFFKKIFLEFLHFIIATLIFRSLLRHLYYLLLFIYFPSSFCVLIPFIIHNITAEIKCLHIIKQVHSLVRKHQPKTPIILSKGNKGDGRILGSSWISEGTLCACCA